MDLMSVRCLISVGAPERFTLGSWYFSFKTDEVQFSARWCSTGYASCHSAPRHDVNESCASHCPLPLHFGGFPAPCAVHCHGPASRRALAAASQASMDWYGRPYGGVGGESWWASLALGLVWIWYGFWYALGMLMCMAARLTMSTSILSSQYAAAAQFNLVD